MEEIALLNHYPTALAKSKPEKTLLAHTQEVVGALEVLQRLGYIPNERIYQLSKAACYYHDYGKLNDVFQERLRKQGRFNASREVPHQVLSVYLIDPEQFEQKEDYYLVLNAVLNHHRHGDGNNWGQLQRTESIMLSQTLLAGLPTFPPRVRAIKRAAELREDPDAIWVKGLLHKCDYSASAGILAEYPADFLQEALLRLLTRWQEKDKSAGWNDLQIFAKEHQADNLLITAQTGMGKTEAGLLWIGDHKGFFVLPIKAAINAIYDRVCDDILQGAQIRERVGLLHGDSLSYYRQKQQEEDAYDDELMAYHRRSRQLSMPLNISTPDQLFDFVFRFGDYELKLATLAYSRVVIDEIQAYGADLLAYLVYGLKRIVQQGGKVAVLTATLPPFVKDLLMEEPLPIEFAQGVFINDLKRHHLQVREQELTSADILSFYWRNDEQGANNKILVVLNTVAKAQEVYQELWEAKAPVELLHSKFIAKDRRNKENAFREDGRTDCQRSVIWVATQVVEASLDVDFDYLFTELSDLNSLFQRLGRCNRKGVKPVSAPNCFVYTEIKPTLLTNTQGDRGFIDRQIFALSKEALRGMSGVLTEQDKLAMINRYLTMDALKGSAFLKNYKAFYQFIESLYINECDAHLMDRKLRNIQSYPIIPQSVYEENQDILQSAQAVLAQSGQALLPKERESLLREKLAAREIIMQYVVQVGRYDLYRLKNNLALTLSRYETIPVIMGHYDAETGFSRYSRQEAASAGAKLPFGEHEMDQESSDSFM